MSSVDRPVHRSVLCELKQSERVKRKGANMILCCPSTEISWEMRCEREMDGDIDDGDDGSKRVERGERAYIYVCVCVYGDYRRLR